LKFFDSVQNYLFLGKGDGMEKVLEVSINEVRGIKSLQIKLPLSKGLYAITGKNGSGKSTLMAAIANLYFRDVLNKFFYNSVKENSYIRYQKDGSSIIWKYCNQKWSMELENGGFFINGFYEGSVIYGNRFRDTNYSALYNATKVKIEDLVPADSFIKDNLSFILHGNKDQYHNLYRLERDEAYKKFKFRGSPYFIVTTEGQIISQFSLSTGESLLVSILHSLKYKIDQMTKKEGLYMIMLDEIELALHPSALVRLITTLQKFSSEYGIAIYFSTHSIELLRAIPPDNIFYLQKHLDKSVEVINPCYPAYATRSIYTHDRYDMLILTEDELTKRIVDWVLKKYYLLTSRLIHILPVGGWENVLSLQQDIIANNILGIGSRCISVLDGDVKKSFREKYINKGLHKNLNVAFLPIKSAEKFLKEKLIDNVDFKFFRAFGDTFYRSKSLEDVLEDYLRSRKNDDSTGKSLLRHLREELNSRGISDNEFYSLLTEYIVETQDMNYLHERLKDALEKDPTYV